MKNRLSTMLVVMVCLVMSNAVLSNTLNKNKEEIRFYSANDFLDNPEAASAFEATESLLSYPTNITAQSESCTVYGTDCYTACNLHMSTGYAYTSNGTCSCLTYHGVLLMQLPCD